MMKQRVFATTAKAFKIIRVNITVFLVLLLLTEASLQVIAIIRPSYDVLFLQPDKVLGWKQVPNLRWTWAGHYWYASDFSVNVGTNPLGFRDFAREFHKPHLMKRVALLGDSFIEAVQVPLEKTAGQLLEQSLNASLDQDLERSRQWEVLNFGISNYGVGQYLLTWDQYVRYYEPDYIAIFVAKFHMKRTVREYEYGAFRESKESGLRIRPTFRVENDELILEPAKDFDEFVKAQRDLINTKFSGQRSSRRKSWITVYYAKRLKSLLAALAKRFHDSSKKTCTSPIIDTDSEAKLLTINIKIIEELGRKAASARSRLIVLDASRYFGDNKGNKILSSALEELCSEKSFGYIPLYDELLRANADGISTRWAHDRHFNEAGNEIVAKALFGYITQHSQMNESPVRQTSNNRRHTDAHSAALQVRR